MIGSRATLPGGRALALSAAPEVPPAERLWPLTNDPLANHHFLALDALQDGQAHRCLTLQAVPEVIRSDTNFHWWPQTA
ncbi:MAG TPA: hypothetical protein VHN13_14900 [Candidatus Tectomicrobia bacterium]|nr:hypothetical protein [Candidatus Tectomicrobia bacterium]